MLSICVLAIISAAMLPESTMSANTPCLCLDDTASGMVIPLTMVEPQDGTGRLIVLSQDGTISIYFRNGSRLPEPFVDITDRVELGRSKELGLFAMGLHPNFTTNGRFYIYYTTTNTTGNVLAARLSQMHVSMDNPNRADDSFADEQIMLELEKNKKIHNGGQILFDSHGYMYIMIGDGGRQGDPDNFAQSKSSYFGKILRLDVSDPDPDVLYKIPSDNPFVDEPGALPEIYAYGCRNPFSGGIDRGDPRNGYGKDRIMFGDIGWRTWEEINLLPSDGAGSDFGWNRKEGFECRLPPCPDVDNEILPLRALNRGEGNAVIGGTFYRGCMNPKLNGVGFYGDWSFGRLFSMVERRKNTNVWTHEDMLFCEESKCSEHGLSAWNGGHVYGYAEDIRGEVFILTARNTRATEPPEGRIFRIVDPSTIGVYNEDCSDNCGRPDRQFRTTLTVRTKTCNNCSCRDLRKIRSIFRRACVRNLKGVYDACCRDCIRKGFFRRM